MIDQATKNDLLTIAEALLGFRAGWEVKYIGPRPHARGDEMWVTFEVQPMVFEGEKAFRVEVQEKHWLAAVDEVLKR